MLKDDALQTRGLTKVYRGHLNRRPVHSLTELDLTVKAGELYGFLGQNGAGKTTTIKIVCSLLRPSSGTAHLFGEDARHRKTRRLVGYLPENPYFYEYLTPRETILFYGRLEGLKPAVREAEWERLADLLDLREIGNRRVRGFSKGMRQRLGFAVALVGDPPLLVLDEPMSGLDPLGRRRIRELMLRLRRQGKTLFFSSHVLGDVEQICDRVGVLVQGRLTSEGRLDELLSRRVQRIEVIVRGLEGAALEKGKQHAAFERLSEAGLHFSMGTAEEADAFVRDVQAQGGRLVEFAPVKESLEDYFMRADTQRVSKGREAAEEAAS